LSQAPSEIHRRLAEARLPIFRFIAVVRYSGGVPTAERALQVRTPSLQGHVILARLARADGVDFEEVCAEWRGGGDAADYQDLVACLCELAGEDGGLCLLDQSFEVAR
jgi:hypothetical protein